jgi:hypothetical protein
LAGLVAVAPGPFLAARRWLEVATEASISGTSKDTATWRLARGIWVAVATAITARLTYFDSASTVRRKQVRG